MKPKLKLIKNDIENDGVREIDMEVAYELYYPNLDNIDNFYNDDENILKVA